MQKIFFNLTNQFNSISHEAFFNVIAKSFPEKLPLTTLFYDHTGIVHHKWADVTQGCPLSPIFASLVVTNLLQPLDIELRIRATTWLLNGDHCNDGFGGTTHLLEYVDNISACVPLANLQFLCD